MEKRISSHADQAVAGMIAELLRSQGLHPRPINIAGHISVAGAGQSYDLWLSADEEAAARRILQKNGYADSLAR